MQLELRKIVTYQEEIFIEGKSAYDATKKLTKNIVPNKLKNIIVSEETKFWKFITRNKYLDIDRIKLDERLISNFYKNKGYYNAEILSSFAQLSSSKNFILTDERETLIAILKRFTAPRTSALGSPNIPLKLIV